MAKGYTLDGRSVRRVGRVVRHVERDPTYLTRSPVPLRQYGEDETVTIINTTGEEIPQYGLCWIISYKLTEPVFQVKKAEYPGVTKLAIACASIAAGLHGSAWMAGTHKLLVEDYADIKLWNRVGAKKDSWYAVEDDLGPIQYVGEVPSGEQPSGLPEGVGLILGKITGKRGDHQFVRRVGTEFAAGSYQVLKFGSEWTVSQSEPGVIKVSYTG